MHGKKILLLITVAVFVLSTLLALPGCGDSGEPATKEPIKIGVVLSASGPNEPLGQPERKAIELFVDRLNEEGGIDGREIEVIIKDDESDANKALEATVELIEQDEVVALIGSSGTGPTLSMKQEATTQEIPQVCMAAGLEIMDGDITWIFRTPPSSAEAGENALMYIKDVLGVKRIALLYDTNAFGTDGKNVIEALAPDYDLEVVVSEGYQTDESEEGMDTHLTNIQTADPEIVLVWGTNPGPAKIAKKMQDKGMDIPYMGSHGIANQTFIELGGDAANGVLFPAGKMLIWEKALEPGSDQYDFMEDFSTAYSEEYGENVNTFAGHGWDAILIITEALKRAGADATPADLRDAIEETSGLVGTAGIFSYTSSNHSGLSPDDLVMVEIVDGAWEIAPGQE
ncbi:MAG: ABC transporter substrate-binding protein [Actinobacteria bacterium]|nr:ABC transporter substrate-binding protein [Actinomycetota bacterium]